MLQVLRFATLDDLAAVVELEQSGTPAKEAYSRRQYRHLLSRAQGVVLVEQEDGQLRGMLTLLWRRGSAVARVYDLVVRPQHRRQGIAGALLEQAYELAAGQGLRWLSVEAAVTNIPARFLYQRFGFTFQKRLPNYYEGGRDGIRYRKAVSRKTKGGRHSQPI